MTAWLIASIGGVALALLPYGWREPRDVPRRAPLVALRAIALCVLLALALDAPAGPRRALAPLVALDASASWLRGGDSTAWRAAVARARSLGSDSIVLFGDSVRGARRLGAPTDAASRAQPLAERALGAGRPLVLITDGELDDAGSLPSFPAGSRVEVVRRAPQRDVAVVSLDAPRAVVSGDTLEARVTVRNGALAPPAPHSDRTQTIRVPYTMPAGSSILTISASVDGDAERLNDTLSVPIEVGRAAGAVLLSASPDFDARFLIPVLRGAVALPTRAYFQVAPGVWRQEGSLAPVSAATVRSALREAPLAILHGDTALFGAPRSVTTGSLALIAPISDTTGEWYPVAAPPSPISSALAGLEWDSLPPLAAST